MRVSGEWSADPVQEVEASPRQNILIGLFCVFDIATGTSAGTIPYLLDLACLS